MKKSETQWLTRIGVILPFLLGSSFALGQVVGDTETIDITVDDGRPMAAAIGKIEGLSGIPINYEDMPVYYEADMKPTGVAKGETPPPGVHLTIVPSGGQLSFSITVDAATGKLNDLQAVEDALSAAISAYNSSNLPGDFEFEYYNGVFFVKPVSYRDASGDIRPTKSLLSTPITLPEEKRDAYLTLRLIQQQLSKAAGSDVHLGVIMGMPREITFGADNEPADHVIARYIAAMVCPGSRSDLCDPAIAQNSWDVGRSYSLLCQPGWGCALNVHQVANSPWRAMPPPPKPRTPPSPQPQVGFPRSR